MLAGLTVFACADLALVGAAFANSLNRTVEVQPGPAVTVRATIYKVRTEHEVSYLPGPQVQVTRYVRVPVPHPGPVVTVTKPCPLPPPRSPHPSHH